MLTLEESYKFYEEKNHQAELGGGAEKSPKFIKMAG